MSPAFPADRIRGLDCEIGEWCTGVLAAAAVSTGGQRTAFSSGNSPTSGRPKQPMKERPPSSSTTMDEETRRSIGESDKKAKKSMKMVKVRFDDNYSNS